MRLFRVIIVGLIALVILLIFQRVQAQSNGPRPDPDVPFLSSAVVGAGVWCVGLFLVFATLVVPALATFYSRTRRLAKGYCIGVLGYALGLAASLAVDLPSGPMIVSPV